MRKTQNRIKLNCLTENNLILLASSHVDSVKYDFLVRLNVSYLTGIRYDRVIRHFVTIDSVAAVRKQSMDMSMGDRIQLLILKLTFIRFLDGCL